MSHPARVPARAMTAEEKKTFSETVQGLRDPRDPVRVQEVLAKPSASLELLGKLTAAALKAFMKANRIKPLTGRKRDLVQRVWRWWIQRQADHDGKAPGALPGSIVANLALEESPEGSDASEEIIYRSGGRVVVRSLREFGREGAPGRRKRSVRSGS